MTTNATSTLHDDTWPSARYLIINTAQVEPSLWEDLQPLRIVPRTWPTPSPFPSLVDTHALDDAQRARLRARARVWERETDKPYVMAWLNAAKSPTALVTHLGNRMCVRRPEGRDDALRFYDPFVFRHLQGWLLNAEQMDSVLGPIQAWHWQEPDGTWRSVRPSCDVPSMRPLRLTPEQWPPLLRMSVLNRALTTLARIDPALAWKLETARQIDALIRDAKELYGITERRDRVLYALQAVRFHPAIHSHPLLQWRLRQCKAGAITYIEACTDLNDERLQALAHELETMEVSPR